MNEVLGELEGRCGFPVPELVMDEMKNANRAVGAAWSRGDTGSRVEQLDTEVAQAFIRAEFAQISRKRAAEHLADDFDR